MWGAMTVASPAGSTRNARFIAASCGVWGALSVTCTVSGKVPSRPGDPEIMPSPESVTPSGSCPAVSRYTSGGAPPVAESAVWYRVPR